MTDTIKAMPDEAKDLNKFMGRHPDDPMGNAMLQHICGRYGYSKGKELDVLNQFSCECGRRHTITTLTRPHQEALDVEKIIHAVSYFFTKDEDRKFAAQVAKNTLDHLANRLNTPIPESREALTDERRKFASDWLVSVEENLMENDGELHGEDYQALEIIRELLTHPAPKDTLEEMLTEAYQIISFWHIRGHATLPSEDWLIKYADRRKAKAHD